MGGYGGAFYLSEQSTAVIYSSVFEGNIADFRGGALYEDYGSNITCISCSFNGNVAYGHGGAWFAEDRNSQTSGTYPVLYNSTFTSNSATRYGGAATFFNGVTPSIEYCIFNGNSAEIGGAVAGVYNFVLKSNLSNVFTNNRATSIPSSNNFYNGTAPSWTSYDHNYTFNTNTYLSTLWDNRAVTATYNDDVAQSSHLCYVNQANGDNCPQPECTNPNLDGSTWAKAYFQLQYCIDRLNVTGGEIWVAQGTYYPLRSSSWAVSTDAPFYSFLLAANISLYGGFFGNETSRSQRNWKAFPTSLSCYVEYAHTHCAITVIAANNCILDGFILTNATYYVPARRRLGQNGEYSSSLVNVITSTAVDRGAGVFSNGTNIVVVNSIFLQNYADKGGGLYCIGYDFKAPSHEQSPTLVNNYFLGNTASSRGGAISADAFCHFTCNYCYFEYNRTPLKGGAIYCDYHSEPTLNNSIFQNNYAWEAGGVFGADGGSYVTMAYPKFFNNSATWEGGALYAGSHEFNESEGFTLITPTFEYNECTYGFDDIYVWPGASIDLLHTPTSYPTNAPTNTPTTHTPTHTPTTYIPTLKPTTLPTHNPTLKPTTFPTILSPSAINGTVSFTNQNDSNSTISNNVIYGVVAAGVVALLVIGIAGYWYYRKKKVFAELHISDIVPK